MRRLFSNVPVASASAVLALCGFIARADAQEGVSESSSAKTTEPGSSSNEVLQEVVVVGREYRVTEVTGNKLTVPIIQVPQSIQVINHQIIEDQRPLSLSDMLRNVSGFTAHRHSGETFRALNLRGFNLIDASVDGLRNTWGIDVGPEAIVNVERIEVLKGPAGALAGRGGLGGTLNIVTKRPAREFRGSVSMSTGTGDLIQPTLDVTGPLNSSGSIRGRLMLDYEERDTPINFVDLERQQAAIALAFDLSDSTVLDVDVDYRYRKGMRVIGIPRYGTLIGLDDIRLPFDFFVGEPGQGDTINSAFQPTIRLTHNLNDVWSVIATARLVETRFDSPVLSPRALLPDNRNLPRVFRRFDDEAREIAGDVYASGRLQTGSVAHNVVLGADWADWQVDDFFYGGSACTLNIETPVYGCPVTNIFLFSNTQDTIEGWGVYLQDQIDITENLHVMAGVRFDDMRKTRLDYATGVRTVRNDTVVSPRLGVSYEFRKGMALFGSYGEGVIGVNDASSNPTGTPFSPNGGRQIEAGVKFDVLDGLTLTVAAFKITQTGVLVPDPNNPPFSIQSGEQQSKGYELDATYQATEGLSLMASFAHIDAEITEDTVLPVGNELRAVPANTGRLWAKYAFPAMNIGTFAMGGGVTYADEQWHDTTNTLLIPSYTVADASLFWEIGRYGMQLNVNNLFDKEYILRGALGNSGVIPGDPRRVVLTAKVAF